jgi:succinate dehydrogenase/fumarate reductase flavoprotein subunit
MDIWCAPWRRRASGRTRRLVVGSRIRLMAVQTLDDWFRSANKQRRTIGTQLSKVRSNPGVWMLVEPTRSIQNRRTARELEQMYWMAGCDTAIVHGGIEARWPVGRTAEDMEAERREEWRKILDSYS